MNRVVGIVAILLACLLTSRPAVGQMLRGKWVAASEQRIATLRKADVRAIVLDAHGKPVPLAKVHIRMTRHAFPWGVAADPKQFKDDESVPKFDWADRPVYRALNSVSLSPMARFDHIHREAAGADYATLDRAVRWAESAGLHVRLGELTSADQAATPQWANDLPDAALVKALTSHVAQTARRYGNRAIAMDVQGRLLDHAYVDRRLGRPVLRQLHHLAGGRAATRCVRVHDAMHGQRLHRLTGKLLDLRQTFVPVDAVAIETKLTGTVSHSKLQRSLDRISKLDLTIAVVDLEVTGVSETAAAINLETALRTLFADASVTGIWLRGVESDQVTDPTASLVDADGELKLSGQVFDHMVARQWWTDTTVTANELGEVRARVFAGWHDLTHTPSSGSAVTLRAHVATDSGQSLDGVLVLQPKPVATTGPVDKATRPATRR